MKQGDKITFTLFGAPQTGTIRHYNRKEKYVDVIGDDGYNYPRVQILRALPKKKSDIPPWYYKK